MSDKPSPRLDALRAMREANYQRSQDERDSAVAVRIHDRKIAAQQEMARANADLAKRKKEDTMREPQDQQLYERSAQAFNRDLEKVRKAKLKDLEDQASNAAARANAATDRRKAKKAAKRNV